MFNRRGRSVLLCAWVGILLLGACGPAATPTERVKVVTVLVTEQPTPTRPVVVTTTRAATKTPVPTTVRTAATGGAGVLFKEHFDTGIGSWFTGPNSSIWAYCDASVQDGKYQLGALINTDNSICFVDLPAFSASDGTITFEASIFTTNAGKGEASVGVIWRQDDEGTNESFYFFNDGTYRMMHWEKGSDEELVPRTYSEYMSFRQGMTNVISVTAQNKQFTVFANGHPLYSVTSEKANAKGNLALFIGADKVKQHINVNFDDVVVTQPVGVPAPEELIAMAPTPEPSPTPTRKPVVSTPRPRPTAAPAPTKAPPTAAPVADQYIMLFIFGAQGCPYSRKAGPTIETFYRNYAGQVPVDGVAVDGWGSDVQDFRNATGISFPVRTSAAPSIGGGRIPLIILNNQRTGQSIIVSQGVISYQALVSRVEAVRAGKQIAMNVGGS